MIYTRLNPNNGIEIRYGVKQITIPQGQAGKNEDVTYSPAFTKSNTLVVATDNDWRTPYDSIPKIAVLQRGQAGFKLHVTLQSAQSAVANINVGWIAIAW